MANTLSFYENFEGFTNLTADKSDLKDKRGVSRTKSLFVDFQKPDGKFNTYYTLREYERFGYMSAYIVYMTSVDEAEAAMKLVGSQYHWDRLCSLKWFVDGHMPIGHRGITQWRKDMAARDESAAKKALMQEAGIGNVTAAKALHQYAAQAAKQKAQVKKLTPVTTDEDNVVDFAKILEKLGR